MNQIAVTGDRLTLGIVYETVKAIESLAWEHDDMITQETLFRLQESIADLALNLAVETGKADDLLKSFPWLYVRTEEG